MRTIHYVLDEHGIPVAADDDLDAWGRWMSRGIDARTIARDRFGDVWISTVFLGMDHAYDGPPMLFETMVFGGPLDEEMDRYSTRDEALRGHARMRVRVTGSTQ